MSVDSRVCVGCKLFMWLVSLPRCVMMIMYIEYKEVIRMFVPKRIMDGLDQENRDTVIISSPIKLIVGGRARLAKLAIIHHVAIKGNTICNPRAIIIVRLWMRS